jgi:hypothetical protein
VAGFLDKNTRVVDMVLTGLGKSLLARGELGFVYWAAFDDEVDYVPFISTSGSLTGEALSGSIDDQIDATLVREATTGYRFWNSSGSDETNVRLPLFTAPQGHAVIPRMTASDGPTGSIHLEVTQQKFSEMLVRRDPSGKVTQQLGPYDRGFERFDASTFSLEYGYTQGSWPADHSYEGFLVRVFRSGSDGLQELEPRHDLSNELAYSNDLRLTVDTDA